MSPKTTPPVNDLDSITHILGDALRDLRKAAGYTSYEHFAREFELSRIHYYQMEKGTNCTLKSLVRVLNDHELDFFLFFEGITSQNKHHAN